jgi:hypothetical protein
MVDAQQTIAELLGPVLDLLLRRNEIGAAKDAGSMMFWRNGMVKHLELIAQGNGTEETFAKLNDGIAASEDRIRRTMERLTQARNRLAGSKLADQIDRILHDVNFGKGGIRAAIQYMVRFYQDRGAPDLPEEFIQDVEELSLPEVNDSCGRKAKEILSRIADFNKEVERLNRMVRDGA